MGEDFKLKISLPAARVNAELTQQKAAEAMGVTKETLRNWETGRTKLSVEAFMKMCKLYGMPQGVIRLPQRSTRTA